jgi:outer membrane protein assembly factor BamA
MRYATRRAAAWVLGIAVVVAEATTNEPARAQVEAASVPRRVERLVVHGNTKTKWQTFAELLPARLPATLTPVQIAEMERRLSNLEIFDAVAVKVQGDTLEVTVREKWTLTPSFSLSTGKTLKDTSITLGATEYNFLGRASILGVEASYDQRRPNGVVYFEDHGFRSDRAALSTGAFFSSGSLRFEQPDAAWFRDQVGGWIGAKLPYSFKLPLRASVGVFYFYERLSDHEGAVHPPDGHAFGPNFKLTWDQLKWHDLTPSGFRASVEVSPTAFVPTSGDGPAQPRHSVTAITSWAVPWGERFVFTGRVVADAYAPGNANHTALLGSVAGVRGLADAFYRNHLQGYSNIEARYAIKLLSRLALQPVVFLDSAVFLPVDAAGQRRSWQHAVAVGGGVRLIPTFLTRLLLRLDVAHLVAPTREWFVQFGITQYF